jgi:hypothetical protein
MSSSTEITESFTKNLVDNNDQKLNSNSQNSKFTKIGDRYIITEKILYITQDIVEKQVVYVYLNDKHRIEVIFDTEKEANEALSNLIQSENKSTKEEIKVSEAPVNSDYVKIKEYCFIKNNILFLQQFHSGVVVRIKGIPNEIITFDTKQEAENFIKDL